LLGRYTFCKVLGLSVEREGLHGNCARVCSSHTGTLFRESGSGTLPTDLHPASLSSWRSRRLSIPGSMRQRARKHCRGMSSVRVQALEAKRHVPPLSTMTARPTQQLQSARQVTSEPRSLQACGFQMDAAEGSEDVHLILPMEEDLTQLKAAAYFVDRLQSQGGRSPRSPVLTPPPLCPPALKPWNATSGGGMRAQMSGVSECIVALTTALRAFCHLLALKNG